MSVIEVSDLDLETAEIGCAENGDGDRDSLVELFILSVRADGRVKVHVGGQYIFVTRDRAKQLVPERNKILAGLMQVKKSNQR